MTEETAAVDAVEETPRRRVDWVRVTALGLLPGLALVLAIAAGLLKYVDNSVRESSTARTESVKAAEAATVAMLSYTPDAIDRQLGAARNLLTGDFKKRYTDLIDGAVIPTAKQRMVTAVATVPAAAVISAEPTHAVLVVYVDQTVTIGRQAPTKNVSSVRETMDQIDGTWLVSAFDPIPYQGG